MMFAILMLGCGFIIGSIISQVRTEMKYKKEIEKMNKLLNDEIKNSQFLQKRVDYLLNKIEKNIS